MLVLFAITVQVLRSVNADSDRLWFDVLKFANITYMASFDVGKTAISEKYLVRRAIDTNLRKKTHRCDIDKSCLMVFDGDLSWPLLQVILDNRFKAVAKPVETQVGHHYPIIDSRRYATQRHNTLFLDQAPIVFSDSRQKSSH